MASADVVANSTDVGLHRLTNDIDRALSLRREEMEREVNEFREQKEREYQEYESQLRGYRPSPSPETVTTGPRQNNGRRSGETKPRRPSLTRMSSEERRATRKPLTARQALDDAFKSNREESSELEGVFTPEYLPLINGNKRASTGSLHPPLAGVEKEQLSSSATLHPPLLFPWASSPLEAPAVSSSAPEPSNVKIHQRSDSANSVSSLRSSMKDPKTPKSPKRVLFSIEDGVVSPSSSPTLIRKPGGPAEAEGDVMESMFRFAKRTGREKKKRNRRKERSEGDRGRRGRDEAEEVPPQPEVKDLPDIQAGWVRPLVTNGGMAAHPLAANEIGSPAEQDELVRADDDDDLFAFDEELKDGQKDKMPDTADGVIEDEEVEAPRPLTETGTSPHAGSLPIEIKWPGRRDSTGAG